RFKAARLALQEGIALLPRDEEQRKAGLDRIRQARKAYEELLKSSARIPQFQQEALAQAACACEVLGERDEAIKLLKRLVEDKEAARTFWGKDAEKQLARLKAEDNQKDLDEIAAKYGP